MKEGNGHVWHGWTTPIEQLRERLERQNATRPVGDKKRSSNRLALLLQRHELALERLGECRPELHRGHVDVTLTSEEVDELINAVCRNKAGYELRDTQRYIIKGLAQGVAELGWDIPVPAPIAVNTTESSSVTPESFVLLSQYDALEQAFWDDLHSDVFDGQSPDMSREAGRLLFSMVFHSGVCNKHWLSKVPESIRQGAGLCNGVVWLDLGTPTELENADSVDRRRRQFLAPVTQLLLRRWYECWGTNWPKDSSGGAYRQARAMLQNFARELCSRACIAKSVGNQCLQLSAANLATTLPSVLLHYSRSSHIGGPLPEHNWLRLLTDRKPDKSIQSPTPIAKTGSVKKLDSITVGTEYPEQYALFRELQRSVDVQPVSAALKNVEDFLHKDDISPILQLMAAWALHLLQRGGAAKKKLEQRSVLRYLNWIRPLIYYADDLSDPSSMDEDEWQVIYDEIIANSRGVAADRAGRLVAFHEFLEKVHDMPPVDVAGASGERQVDARILTPREYGRARRYLQMKSKDDDWAEGQEILLILGYRCGLRRGEAFSRRFGDFPGMDDPFVEEVELLVRPNKVANIKSEVGTRRLPLRLLLTDEELSCLRKFYQRRRMLVMGAAESQLIFADFLVGRRPAVNAHLFDPLTRLLRAITGDGRFRFHSLRHSFVTLTFLRLMEASPGEHLLKKWCYDEEGAELLPSMAQPLWRQAGLTDTGQSPWLLAMWAGHASPSMTLECYSHLLNWLMMSYIRKRHNPLLSLKSQAKLLGKTPSALEKWRQRRRLRTGQTSAKDLSDMLAGNWPAGGRRDLFRLNDYDDVSVEQLEKDQSPTRQAGLMDPYNLMFWSEVKPPETSKSEPLGLDTAAAMVGITVEEAGRWQRNAWDLMSMRTTRSRRADKEKQVSLADENRARFYRDDEIIRWSLENKNVNKGLPSLPNFIAPPKTRAGREHAMQYFDALLDWYDQSPGVASQAMESVVKNLQSSHTSIRPRSLSDQQRLYCVLCRLRLKSRTTIQIRHTPTTSIHKLRHVWAERFDTEIRNIKCVEVDEHLAMGAMGRSQILVDPPKALYRNQRQNLFWDAFRFALMSAYVVCSDPELR